MREISLLAAASQNWLPWRPSFAYAWYCSHAARRLPSVANTQNPDDKGWGRLAGVALFCIGTASAFGWLLAYYKIPEALLANVSTWGMGPIAAGFFISFCFLVVGCFLDAIPAIVIVGTVLEPLARSVDLHPVQFAIISIVSLAFGLVTPPYGLPVPHDRLRHSWSAAALCAQGYGHHADTDAARAGGAHHLAQRVPFSAAPDCQIC
ncbi:TRAP transporter large permease subunit [Bradyrhizobium sediminis]|uniref:TRAP transporter large permease subunit n=1 Tax=Bradyrhizobium sediminis TaxID=2840469 RepID=UPI00201C0C23|nr:TRAP transporter large permease subunit [Bradyrhizobium sediminis]